MAARQLEETPFWLDVENVAYSGPKPVKFDLKGMLHTEKEDIPIMQIVSIDTVRDYVTNIGDHIQIEFKMPMGEYIRRLYPYRRNLEFTVKYIELEEIGNSKIPNSKIRTEKFKAVFLIDKNKVVSTSELESLDDATLNSSELLDVKFQLLDRSLEVLRTKTTHGIFQKVTTEDLIFNILSGESTVVKIDGKSSIDGIDITEPNNKEVKDHIIIPYGSLMSAIPTYLQDKMGGVYSNGIGTYLQVYNKWKIWFVYPLYDWKRFDGDLEKAIIYAVPPDRLSGIDRTYKTEAKLVHILATAQKTYNDSGDTDYMNHGVGFRMADARAFMQKPVKMTEDGPVGDRGNLNHEVGQEDRKDGLNYAPVTSEGISSNPFKEYSKIAARNVARIDFVWENAKPDLLYPGMPCKYIFISDNVAVELKGTILYVQFLTSLQGNSLKDSTYRTICQVTIVTERHNKEMKIPKIEPYGDF